MSFRWCPDCRKVHADNGPTSPPATVEVEPVVDVLSRLAQRPEASEPPPKQFIRITEGAGIRTR